MNSGIIEIDVHGMNQSQVKTLMNKTLKDAKQNVSMIRVIHGYQHGTAIRQMLRRQYRTHPRVKHIVLSLNPGITEFVLK